MPPPLSADTALREEADYFGLLGLSSLLDEELAAMDEAEEAREGEQTLLVLRVPATGGGGAAVQRGLLQLQRSARSSAGC